MIAILAATCLAIALEPPRFGLAAGAMKGHGVTWGSLGARGHVPFGGPLGIDVGAGWSGTDREIYLTGPSHTTRDQPFATAQLTWKWSLSAEWQLSGSIGATGRPATGLVPQVAGGLRAPLGRLQLVSEGWAGEVMRPIQPRFSDPVRPRISGGMTVALLASFGKPPKRSLVTPLNVYLRDPAGAPIESGTVTVGTAVSRTDRAGLASFSLPNGHYTVAAEAAGMERATSGVQLLGIDPVEATVNMAPPGIIEFVRDGVEDALRALDRQEIELVLRRLGARIHFKVGSDVLEKDSLAALTDLASFLEAQPKVPPIRVDGHTDTTPAPAQTGGNLGLAVRRACAVVQYLRAQGVTASLTAYGWGEHFPIGFQHGAGLPVSSAANRRVEFVTDESRKPIPKHGEHQPVRASCLE